VGAVGRQSGSTRRQWDATCAEGLDGVTGSLVGVWGVAEGGGRDTKTKPRGRDTKTKPKLNVFGELGVSDGGRKISSQLQKFFRERGCGADGDEGDEGGEAMGKKAVKGKIEAEAEDEEQVTQIVEEKEGWVEEEDQVVEGEGGLGCWEEEVMEKDWLAMALPAISEALLNGQRRVDLFDVDLVCARPHFCLSVPQTRCPRAQTRSSHPPHPAAAPGAEAPAMGAAQPSAHPVVIILLPHSPVLVLDPHSSVFGLCNKQRRDECKGVCVRVCVCARANVFALVWLCRWEVQVRGSCKRSICLGSSSSSKTRLS